MMRSDRHSKNADAVLIRQAWLVDPSASIDGERDLLVVSGRVARVGTQLSVQEIARTVPGLEVIEGKGLWLWPGLVDVHVHLREPGQPQKETIASGCRAAAAGGYTTVVCEPNTRPPLDSLDVIRQLAEKIKADACVNVYCKAALTLRQQGEEPTDVVKLAEHPLVVALSDDGNPIVSRKMMERLCRDAAEHGLLISPHCEDSPQALRQYEQGVEAGFEAQGAYTNECNYIERDLAIARACGCKVHFSHVSRARSVELIHAARARGGDAERITYEVTPHHLLLSGEDYGPGEAPRVNPPLRNRADREALQRALAPGGVDVIASDHAPHTAADKAAGAMGLIGMETTLGLVLTHFVHAGVIDRLRAAELLSTAPAQIFRLPGGSLREGEPADMVLIDPGAEWTVEPGRFESLSRNTPYAGWQLRGRALATFVAGRRVHEGPGFCDRTRSAKGTNR